MLTSYSYVYKTKWTDTFILFLLSQPLTGYKLNLLSILIPSDKSTPNKTSLSIYLISISWLVNFFETYDSPQKDFRKSGYNFYFNTVLQKLLQFF